ncbi:helix-turn-helix protein [Roseiarcus fermentans]|uniref:Helix-turn-helix protein n=1 Tax=Roseiarcus fermentans TaxID=1473586 RepID=A0A366EQ64_9HYPH|nr:helix-turn-helix transcriptional regulator [Roseiarcus fermentans]RBP03830.1 helix-turn-helix protein [Roseiarcus fermentans]
MSADPSRTARLIELLNLTQAQMAERLGVAQATVSRLVNGQRESGPVAILLDAMEREAPRQRVEGGGPVPAGAEIAR